MKDSINKSAVLELAAFIESGKYKFDMAEPCVNPFCGTAGCIAGHAAMLWVDVREKIEEETVEEFSFSEKKVAEKLGITSNQSHNLFYGTPDGDGGSVDYEDVTRCVAVRTLRHLAETGEIVFKREGTD